MSVLHVVQLLGCCIGWGDKCPLGRVGEVAEMVGRRRWLKYRHLVPDENRRRRQAHLSPSK